MRKYEEEEYLLLSGIQHFSFCQRQWALIHIECQWQDNVRTMEGSLMHERVHADDVEKRGDTLIVRNMPVFSTEMGIRGACDVVEFKRDKKGIALSGIHNEAGTLFRPVPIEYKRGKPKANHADDLQLCAQALCLEEMLLTDIPQGQLYYGEIRRRVNIEFTQELRDEVRAMAERMHDYFKRGYTPRVKTGRHCHSCSMEDICLPKLNKSISVNQYLEKHLTEESER